MTDPQPTQADRDAAASLIETYWSGADANMMKLATSYRAGHSQGAFVRAFTRHAAEREAQVIGGVVAWLRGEVPSAYTDPQFDIGQNLAIGVQRGDWKGPSHAE